MKKKLENAYYFMLTLLSILVFVMFIFISISKITYLSDKYWINSSEKTFLYQEITNDANIMIQDLGLGSGIQENGLEDVFAESDIRKDVENFIRSSFIGKEYEIDEVRVKETILLQVEEYANNNNQSITEENRPSIDNFIDIGFEKYSNLIKNPIIPMIGSLSRLVGSIIKIMLLGLMLFWCVLLFLLFISLKRFTHVFKRWLSYQFISIGVIVILVSVYALVNNIVPYLSVSSVYLINTFNYIYVKPLVYAILIGAIMLIIGILLSVMSTKQRNKEVMRARMKYEFMNGSTTHV